MPGWEERNRRFSQIRWADELKILPASLCEREPPRISKTTRSLREVYVQSWTDRRHIGKKEDTPSTQYLQVKELIQTN